MQIPSDYREELDMYVNGMARKQSRTPHCREFLSGSSVVNCQRPCGKCCFFMLEVKLDNKRLTVPSNSKNLEFNGFGQSITHSGSHFPYTENEDLDTK